MISVENGNLEHALCGLFSQVCSISVRVGYAIYLTPKSALVRIEILQNAARAMLGSADPAETDEIKKTRRLALSKTLKIAMRAKALIGKRHAIIHDSWGVSQDGHVVRFVTPSPNLEPSLVAINDLERLITDFRRVISDTYSLQEELKITLPAITEWKKSITQRWSDA
jgi:hypothetical protein